MSGPDELEPLGRRAYRVEVSGVGGGRNRAGPKGLLVLIGVVALVALGIISSDLFPTAQGVVLPSLDPAQVLVSPDPSGLTPDGSDALPSPPESAGPVPSAPLTARVAEMAVDVAALIADIPHRGTGPLAFVAGRLHSSRRVCPLGAPLSACLSLRIDGIRGASVVPDDSMTSWPGDPAPGQTLVLLPRDGHLVYLGSLTVDSEGIPRIDVLEARLTAGPASDGQPPSSLVEGDGLLLAQVSPCATGDACGGTNSALFAAATLGEGGDLGSGVVVRVMPGALEAGNAAWLDPTWIPGPFLLRYQPADATPWQVVAREDQGTILHVIIP